MNNGIPCNILAYPPPPENIKAIAKFDFDFQVEFDSPTKEDLKGKPVISYVLAYEIYRKVFKIVHKSTNIIEKVISDRKTKNNYFIVD